MSNNLYKVEKDLRSMAKRYKSVKYSVGLAILFLMMGLSAFSEEVAIQENTVATREEIATSKENLRNSVGSLQSKINQAKAENEKGLAGLRLELIQLMEQGDQVVKSPWMSWQFGANYMYSKWNGTYKGREDKSEKYPFEGVYTRSSSTYERAVSPSSKQYSSLATGNNVVSASSNSRNGITSGYGLTTIGPVQEPIVAFDVSAGVRPKQVSKGAITIADKNPITPEQPEAITFNTPVINIIPPAPVSVTPVVPSVTVPGVSTPSPNLPNLPGTLSFSPVSPNINPPTLPNLPVPPTFNIQLGSYCNGMVSCGSGPHGRAYNPQVGTPRSYTAGGTISGIVDGSASLRHGWNNKSGGYSALLFSYFDLTKVNNGVATLTDNLTVTSINPVVTDTSLANFNRQFFLVGGSRVATVDNVKDTTLESTGTINLVGPLTVGFEVQTDLNFGGKDQGVRSITNLGTITDEAEKANTTIQGHLAPGSSETLDLANFGSGSSSITVKNTDGFLGYKVGMILTYEDKDTRTSSNYVFKNDGVIKINGEKSIGIQVFAPGSPSNVEVSNSKDITMKGIESYAMKWSSRVSNNSTMTNTGTINITGDNGTDNSLSSGIAVVENSSFSGSNAIRAYQGKVTNTGTIDVSGGVGNSGMSLIINATDNITNTSIINVKSEAGKNNIGMRVDKGTVATDSVGTPEAINTGTINLSGDSSIGMISTQALATNTGTIKTTGITPKNLIGMATQGGTINNTGNINIDGESNIGMFNTFSGTTAGTATNAGTIKNSTATDKSLIGIYADSGTTTNGGTVNLQGTEVKGIVSNGSTATINNTNTVSTKGDKAVSIAALNGTVNTTGDVNVEGTSGIALYTGGATGVINANAGTINSSNGGINVYADDGKINFSGATINTGANSLAFMQGKGTVNFASATVANIATNGTAFYIPSASTPATPTYSAFGGIGAMSGFSNLNNLTLNMSPNSNIAVASYVQSTVSGLSSSTIPGLTITGSGYNNYLLYKSELEVDAGTTYTDFKKIALSNSSIINNAKLSTTGDSVNLMAQENTDSNKDWVRLINNKTIELKGKDSLAMYASNGKITNAAGASITIGNAGVAIYGSNKGVGDTDIENSGDIKVGEGSTAIFAKNYTTTGLENKGTISLAGDNGIGMGYVPNLISSTTVENKGTISGTASKGTGIYAAKDKNSTKYTALNSGTITLGTNGVGIYTNATSTGTNPLENTGTITVGDNGIGLYGFEENTTGDITVGNSGIGLYSQGGTVSIGSASKTPTITVGNANATAVFTTGNGQTITSTDAKYNVGTNSYGFVNTGTGNTLNISGGTGILTDDGVFIYSSDTTGNITNATKITSTGSNGSNFGIYSAGTVNNSGDITLTNGTGNVGVYAINSGNITNSGTITLGASTSVNRSIGAIANTGTINHTGNIVVNGQYGIGTYSTGSSTVNSSGNITLTGDETIGNYGTSGSNVNLTSGTVTLTGDKSTGYYLDSGKGSTIASGAKINVTGNEANGVYANNSSSLTYNGDTKVSGDAAYGLIVDGSSNVNATGGTLTVNGTSGINGTSSVANANRGSAALVVTSGSSLSGNNLDVTADIAGENSVGVYSAGTLAINSANISAYDSGVNFFTDGGTISIGNNGGTSTVVTGTGASKGALMFYTPSGSILLNGPVNATVEGGSKAATRGTAFYYTGGGALGTPSGYTSLNPTNVATWARNSFGNGTTSTLGNLNLTMNQDSRLFLTERVNMDLSNTSATNLFSGLSAGERPNITGAGSSFRTFMLYHSHLNVDQAVDLDNANDEYNLVEISSSAITNNNTITGTQAGQIAMAQENDTTTKSVVTLTNNGTINLSGLNSAGVYGKNAIINNVNKITVGNSSSGIYGLNNTGISNTGSITTGGSSTAIYYSDVEKDNAGNITIVNNTTTGLKNDGAITLNGDDSVGLTYEAGNITGTVGFENSSTGSITSTGDKNVGMFAKLAQNGVSYDTINRGIITLGNSASMSNPNVAMYTNATSTGTNPLENIGNITVGDYSVGMYGFEENSSGNITVGNGSIGLYSKNGNVNVSGAITTGSSNESVGVYTVGSGQNITSTGTTFNLGDTSFGFVNVGTGNDITSTGGSATLGNNGVYIYSSDKANSITNRTNIASTGTTGGNYGIYASSQVNNSGNIDFGNGVGNLGIYMVNGGTGRNSGTITVGASDVTNELYSVGMAAGYIGDKTTLATTGAIENNGTINVNGSYSIGMYGAGSGTTVTNKNDIILNASNTTGMYVEEGAKAVNDGTIKTGVSGLSNVNGVVLGLGSTLTNNGTINISGTTSNGVLLKGGIIANYGTITVSGAGSKETNTLNSTPTSKKVGPVVINAPAGATSATITAGGVVVTPTVVKTEARNPISVSADSIGLYVNTSGKDYTSSITGLGSLTSKADLIIGAEAAQSTKSKYILVNDSKMLDPYNNAILSSGVSKWDIYSGSLTWLTTPTLDPATGKVTNLYMAKIPYTEWAKDQDTYNFTDGLEQRYGVEELGSRENQVFQKLTSIGNNEEVLLYQAYDEMMGHQYANVQQRVQATGIILDKEFDYLRNEWQTVSKDSNKIKTFGTKGEYKTDTAGVIDYKYNAYGVAYVHENEDIKLGRGIGWYTGIVHNTIKFKDIGNSKEKQLQAKVGIFKSVPFDDNNSLNWTISGDIFAGYNKMNRKFLVVDEIFNAKAKYYTYGIGIKNEIGKEFRLSETFTLRPYVALGLEYGRVSKIREKSGEVKLEVKQNDYISVKPEVGAELAFKHYFGRKTLRTGLSVAYENELGRVAKGKNKAKVKDTSADWFNIRGEKEDRKGNVKFDLNIGLDNQRYGVTANVGYDTKGENLRGGLGLRVIF